MADRNVSKSPRGSLSPDVFRSRPPSFEAAGQQHSTIGARFAGAHAHAHTYARVPARTRPHSARHAVGMTQRNVGISAPDRPPRPLALGVTAGDARPRPPRSGPRERLATDLHRRQSTQTRRLGRKRNAGGIFGGESIPLSHPRGRSGRGGPVFGRAPGRWLSDGHTSSHPAGCRGAASAPPHTPLYARAVNRAEDCLCFKQNLLKSVKRS